jgi:hypothetical protein
MRAARVLLSEALRLEKPLVQQSQRKREMWVVSTKPAAQKETIYRPDYVD